MNMQEHDIFQYYWSISSPRVLFLTHPDIILVCVEYSIQKDLGWLVWISLIPQTWQLLHKLKVVHISMPTCGRRTQRLRENPKCSAFCVSSPLKKCTPASCMRMTSIKAERGKKHKSKIWTQFSKWEVWERKISQHTKPNPNHLHVYDSKHIELNVFPHAVKEVRNEKYRPNIWYCLQLFIRIYFWICHVGIISTALQLKLTRFIFNRLNHLNL